jgi:gamma-glutamylcyclotransferase (GGCT)/AIG2-like uncharacterized protein YtfP
MAPERATTHFLFVYGTLMKGFHEDWQKKVGARLVGRGRINGMLYDLGEYPGAKCSAPDSGEYIKGELYELGDPELAAKVLDRYEEFLPDRPRSSLFVRMTAPVTLEGGRSENAWVYVYNRPVDGTKLVPSGDFRDVITSRER